jgi:hypothetical protein
MSIHRPQGKPCVFLFSNIEKRGGPHKKKKLANFIPKWI